MSDLSGSDEFRRLAHRAVDLIADHMVSASEGQVRRPVPPEVRARLTAMPGLAPMPAAVVLHQVVEDVLAYPMGNSHPSFFGWINSGPDPMAVVGELLAAGMDASVAGGDHAATHLEHGVLAWLRRVVGYPTSAGGLLTSGGSVANLTGLAAMRHWATDGSVRASGMRGGPLMVVYSSEQGHSSVQKALELLGLGSAQLRLIETDDDLRMRVDRLESAIDRDRAAGQLPVCVVASAGTVNSGAIDPLDAIAELCASHNLWLHVDGSYGAFGTLDERLTDTYRGLDRADSVALDPHKWLGIPVECGCALVRDESLMRATFSLVPEYLRDDTELPWFSEFGIQQTRAFRALKLWMALEITGEAGFAAMIRRHNDLAAHLAESVRSTDGLELVAHGPLSIVCFRYLPSTEADIDELNHRVAATIQAEGQAFLTTTVIAGKVALRACIVNRGTSEHHLDDLLDTVLDAGRRAEGLE